MFVASQPFWSTEARTPRSARPRSMPNRAPSLKSFGGEKRARYLSEFWGQAPVSTPSSAEPCGEGSIEIEDAEEAEEDAPTTKVGPTFAATVDAGAAVNALEEWAGVAFTEGNNA